MQDNPLTLEEKIEKTEDYFARLIQEVDLSQISLAWTGGKDSTTLLFLLKSYLKKQGLAQVKEIQTVNLDTGLKFPEVTRFRDELAKTWGVSLQVVKPEVDLKSYPVAKDPVACCRDLKISPLQKYIGQKKISALITGLRRDEHTSRQGREWKEWKDKPGYWQVNPLLHWTEMDIWSFQMKVNLPYCSLYNQGYRSLGCRPCTEKSFHAERSGRSSSKEAKMDLLRSLGYF